MLETTTPSPRIPCSHARSASMVLTLEVINGADFLIILTTDKIYQ